MFDDRRIPTHGDGVPYGRHAAPVRPGHSATVLRDYLDTHRLVWDMPSLFDLFPAVVEHLEDRYEIRRVDGGLVISYLDGSRADETFRLTDVRYVVDILLTREYRALLCDKVGPTVDRRG